MTVLTICHFMLFSETEYMRTECGIYGIDTLFYKRAEPVIFRFRPFLLAQTLNKSYDIK